MLLTRVAMDNKSSVKIIGYALTNVGQHLQNSDFGKLFNVKEFVIHMQLCAQGFFVDAIIGKLDAGVVKNIVYYHDNQKIGPINKISTN